MFVKNIFIGRGQEYINKCGPVDIITQEDFTTSEYIIHVHHEFGEATCFKVSSIVDSIIKFEPKDPATNINFTPDQILTILMWDKMFSPIKFDDPDFDVDEMKARKVKIKEKTKLISIWKRYHDQKILDEKVVVTWKSLTKIKNIHTVILKAFSQIHNIAYDESHSFSQTQQKIQQRFINPESKEYILDDLPFTVSKQLRNEIHTKILDDKEWNFLLIQSRETKTKKFSFFPVESLLDNINQLLINAMYSVDPPISTSTQGLSHSFKMITQTVNEKFKSIKNFHTSEHNIIYTKLHKMLHSSIPDKNEIINIIDIYNAASESKTDIPKEKRNRIINNDPDAHIKFFHKQYLQEIGANRIDTTNPDIMNVLLNWSNRRIEHKFNNSKRSFMAFLFKSMFVDEESDDDDDDESDDDDDDEESDDDDDDEESDDDDDDESDDDHDDESDDESDDEESESRSLDDDA